MKQYINWAHCPECKSNVLNVLIWTKILHLDNKIQFKYKCKNGHTFTKVHKTPSK